MKLQKQNGKISSTDKMVMPSSYALMNEEEMTYVEGGGEIVITCSRNYLNKSTCLSQGNMLVNSKRIVGMTALEIAQELFTHAYALYNYQKVIQITGSIAIASYCYVHAKDGIHIKDNGDSLVRKAAYKLCWNKL